MRMRALEDRIDLANLVARIAHLADSGEVGDYLDCFTADASWELTSATGLALDEQVRRGRADLEAGVVERRAMGMQGPGSRTRHDVSSIAITVDGDRAHGTAYFRYYVDSDVTPTLAAMGRYDDEFVRTPEGWRLQRRVIGRD
jgi:3-phenylpropionate/cinnamic acid dioxygenase small subunit